MQGNRMAPSDSMHGICMAPSDNRFQDNNSSFCGRYEELQQTTPKVLFGAPRKEKGDTPKACNDADSSDKRGPDPDSSLPSIPSVPCSSSAAEEKGTAKYESTAAVSQRDEVMPSHLAERENNKSKVYWSLDNKFVEDLNSRFGDSLDHVLSNNWFELFETEKHENELPEKHVRYKEEKDEQKAKSQTMEKMDALKAALDLSQNNCLTNEKLIKIYTCYRKQDLAQMILQSGPKSNTFSSTLDPGQNFGSINSLGSGITIKEGKIHLDEADLSAEHHMSELLVDCTPSYRLEAVENSFSFQTSAGSASFLTGFKSMQCALSPESFLLSLLRPFLPAIENEWQRRFLSEQKKHKKLPQGDDWNEEKNIGCGENASGKPDEKDDAIGNKEVFEKAEFEENEKPQKENPTTGDAGISAKNSSPLNTPNTHERDASTQETGCALTTPTASGLSRKAERKPSRKKLLPNKSKEKVHNGKADKLGGKQEGSKGKAQKKNATRGKACKTKKYQSLGENKELVTGKGGSRKQQQERARPSTRSTNQNGSRLPAQASSKQINQGLQFPQDASFSSQEFQVLKTRKMIPEKKLGLKTCFLEDAPPNHEKVVSKKRFKVQVVRGAPEKHMAGVKCSISAEQKKLRGSEHRNNRTTSRMPRIRNKERRLPKRPHWIKVDEMVVMVMTRSGTAGGGKGGSISVSSNDQGGGGVGRGGARPKTTPLGGGGGKGQDRDDEEDEGRRPFRKVPDSLPLDPDTETPKKRRGQGIAPPPDFKGYRKKQHHGNLTSEQTCYCLGQAGLGVDVLQRSSGAAELNGCLLLCLHHAAPPSPSPSPTPRDPLCLTCLILHSLLSHYTGCLTAAPGQCSMCTQLFNLVHFHVRSCLLSSAAAPPGEGDGGDVAFNVCHKLRRAGLFAADGSLSVPPAKVWIKVRKYLSKALGPVFFLDLEAEGDETEPADPSEQAPPLPSPAPPVSQGSLNPPPAPVVKMVAPSLPPHSSAVMPKAASQGSSRRPSTKVNPPKTIPEEPVSPLRSPLPSSSLPTAPLSRLPESKFSEAEESDKALPVTTEPVSLPNARTAAAVTTGDQEETVHHVHTTEPASLPNARSAPATTPDNQEDIMPYIRRMAEMTKSKENTASRQPFDDPYSTQRIYGGHGIVSMPEPRSDRHIVVEQNLSVEMQPTGTPGIGEVVYGTHQQLLLVARNWRQERDECKVTRKCRYQHREEGVILSPFKREMKILHTRYQKHQQWERLIHLGNGVTGKCHLCIDRSSNFKFCVKKMHILQYEDQELDIWSELNHPHIVRFFGAIRHGEKIYLFAEFIDGGSLAALIKDQWTVGRRLSHWSVLNYFRQLLTILTYLQSMGVLHEDIKADNILLRKDTTEIVLADLGAAQQIPHDHTPRHRHPTGSPAHWSPEKAASEGHGFPSDLWASACVLIHMLSSNPPWISRFPDAGILNFIIWSKPAPLEDIPDNVREDVRDLIACCLVKDKAIRPTASQILGHRAFLMLNQSGSFFSTFAQPALPAPSCADVVQAAAPSQGWALPPNPQGAPEEGATGGSEASGPDHGIHSAVTPGMTSGNPALKVPLIPMTRSVSSKLAVVEVPRGFSGDVGATATGVGRQPQSLPSFYLPSNASSSAASGGARPTANEDGPTRQQRRSAPASAAPFSLQGRVESNAGNAPKRKTGLVAPTPPQGLSESSSEPALSQGGVRGSLPQRSMSEHHLMPEPLPDLPSPVLTMASVVKDRMQSITSYLSLSSVPSHGPGSAGPSSLPATPAVRASQLNVPAPTDSTASQTRGGETSPTSSLPQTLMSYGTYDGLMSAARQGSAVPSTLQENQRPHSRETEYGGHQGPVDCNQQDISPAASHRIIGRQLDPILERVPLRAGPGPATLLTIPPPEAPTTAGGNYATGPGDAGDTQPAGVTSCTTVAAETSGSLSVAPRVSNSNPFAHPNTTSMPAKYPGSMTTPAEDPCLSDEDIHVSRKPMPFMSIIAEGDESEPEPLSTESGSEALLGYFQDQFQSGSAGSQVPFLQSLAHHHDRRPRLQPYPPPPSLGSDPATSLSREHAQGAMVPMFDQLLSETITLRLVSNASYSSGDIPPRHTQALSHQSSAPGPKLLPQETKSLSSGNLGDRAATVDEPDRATTNGFQASQGSQARRSDRRISGGNSDDDRISSGDMFGSGPSGSPGLKDAFQYSAEQRPRPQAQQQQHQQHQQHQQQHQQQQLQQGPDSQHSVHHHQQQQAPQLSPSPNFSRKHPNLRLDVSSHAAKPFEAAGAAGGGGASKTPHSSQRLHSDDAFLLNPGVSPLSASPLVRGGGGGEGRKRSRNESGSSGSTPKSSTFDRQEQEWVTLQLQTPGLEVMLVEDDPMTASGSELSDMSSSHNTSLHLDQQGENTPEAELSSMLSLLQESIHPQLGPLLVFKDPQGVFLFDMRVRGRDVVWKNLARTFRSQIHKAGFHHFTLTQEDGVTPVNCFTTYEPSIATVTVNRLSEEDPEISSVCWCADHLVY